LPRGKGKRTSAAARADVFVRRGGNENGEEERSAGKGLPISLSSQKRAVEGHSGMRKKGQKQNLKRGSCEGGKVKRFARRKKASTGGQMGRQVQRSQSKMVESQKREGIRRREVEGRAAQT